MEENENLDRQDKALGLLRQHHGAYQDKIIKRIEKNPYSMEFYLLLYRLHMCEDKKMEKLFPISRVYVSYNSVKRFIEFLRKQELIIFIMARNKKQQKKAEKLICRGFENSKKRNGRLVGLRNNKIHEKINEVITKKLLEGDLNGRK